MQKLQTIVVTVTLFALTLSGCVQTNEKESEQLSKKVHQIAKSIAKEDMYMSSAVGYAGTRPEQWDSFQMLKISNMLTCLSFWSQEYIKSTQNKFKRCV